MTWEVCPLPLITLLISCQERKLVKETYLMTRWLQSAIAGTWPEVPEGRGIKGISGEKNLGVSERQYKYALCFQVRRSYTSTSAQAWDKCKYSYLQGGVGHRSKGHRSSSRSRLEEFWAMGVWHYRYRRTSPRIRVPYPITISKPPFNLQSQTPKHNANYRSTGTCTLHPSIPRTTVTHRPRHRNQTQLNPTQSVPTQVQVPSFSNWTSPARSETRTQ